MENFQHEMLINYSYLRPGKAEQLKSWYKNEMVCRLTLSASLYPGAAVLPLRTSTESRLSWGLGGVIDNQNKYISDSAIKGLYDYGYSVENTEIRHEEVVYCGYFRKHWGHFLLDCTNRLWYFLDHPESKYIYFVEEQASTNIEGNYREFFELLGIWDHLEFINRPVRFDRVVIPESSFDRELNTYSPVFTEVFQRVAQTAIKQTTDNNECYERVFLTRSALPKACKQESGMPVIDSYFCNNGYKVISPEKIKLAKMICMIRKAQTVAAFSGTLPHNMLFGKNEQQLIIIERNALNNRYQHYIGQMKQLRTIYIDANYSIYPVELSYGPFIYGYTDCLKRFTRDMGYSEPDQQYNKRAYFRKLLRAYMKAYRKEHYLQWYMGGNTPWMIKETKLLYEAYEESEFTFAPWLSGNEPYKISQIIELRMIKQMIKRTLKSIYNRFKQT